MKLYLSTKNAIIALLVTAIYYSWLIEGIGTFKSWLACLSVYFITLYALNNADRCYLEKAKRKRSEF